LENEFLEDPEFQELIGQFLDYLYDSLPNVKESLSAQDYSEIKKFGHNLKGSGGGYGFDDLGELGRQIDLAAKNEDRQSLETLINEFEKLLDQKRKDFFS
jgi:HPt (histidine-containing phosphotransfer) domain-containing protein